MASVGCVKQNEAMEQKYKKRDDASARLGEKMLQVRNGNCTQRPS